MAINFTCQLHLHDNIKILHGHWFVDNSSSMFPHGMFRCDVADDMPDNKSNLTQGIKLNH